MHFWLDGVSAILALFVISTIMALFIGVIVYVWYLYKMWKIKKGRR